MENGFNLGELFDKYRVQVILAIFGLFLLGIGVLSVVVVSLNQEEPRVEILSAGDGVKGETEIVVDVAGAVEVPGVYRLAKGARVNDALVAAGGLSAKADRVWVARYINLAQLVLDGIKIYIPSANESQSGNVEFTQGKKSIPGGEVAGSQIAGKININTASVSELDRLWGIGEKRASDIMQNRPYATIDELLVKKVIPNNVFERIRDQISVF